MSIIRIKPHKLTVKPFYKGYIIKGEITKKEKIILLRKLYFYYLKMSQNNEVLQIDNRANIDEALYYLFSQFSNEQFKDYTVVLEGSGFDIGIGVRQEYDSGIIPLKAFHDKRKDSDFYDFLLRILAYLHSISCSLFNDQVTEMAIEEMETKVEDHNQKHYYFDDEEYASARIGYKTNKYIIQPMIDKCKLMSAGGVEFKNTEWRKYAQKYPQWAEFIMDFKDVFKDSFGFYHIASLNIDEDARDNGYLDIDSMFHFGWDYRYKDDEHPIDRMVDFYKHSQSGNGYWAEPHVSVNSAKGKYDKNHLKKESKKANRLLKLFIKYYECFDYKQT